jgi:hypothetical protein
VGDQLLERDPIVRDPIVLDPIVRDPIVLDPIVLDRIKAFGLVDCLEAKRVPGRLTGCRTCDTRSRNSPRYVPSRPGLSVTAKLESSGPHSVHYRPPLRAHAAVKVGVSPASFLVSDGGARARALST